MKRLAATLRAVGAGALFAWHGLWFAVGILARVLWTVILIAAAAALAGFQAGRYR